MGYYHGKLEQKIAYCVFAGFERCLSSIFPLVFRKGSDLQERGTRATFLTHAEVLGVLGVSRKLSEILKVDGVPPSLGSR